MSALELLDRIEKTLPELRRLAAAGDLDGDYWPDIDQAAELLSGVIEAFHDDEEPG